MSSMRRRTAIAVGVGAWVAALGSAGALTYDLNRELPLAGASSELAAPVNAAPAVVGEPSSAEPPVLYVSTFTVVGERPSRPVVVDKPKPVTELSQMHCADWRELDMGSGRVRVCE